MHVTCPHRSVLSFLSLSHTLETKMRVKVKDSTRILSHCQVLSPSPVTDVLQHSDMDKEVKRKKSVKVPITIIFLSDVLLSLVSYKCGRDLLDAPILVHTL
mmetsp:Transcript_49636/g.120368  ORF Transcript_49636/g.120368 Transcript_49636/m.120368 type:complete len:101 (+) Transcript_49636:188-490(+)